jgi:hypothetical protein
MSQIDRACPDFHWGGKDKASVHELVTSIPELTVEKHA